MVLLALQDELKSFKGQKIRKCGYQYGELTYVFEPRVFFGVRVREWFKTLFHMRPVSGSIFGHVCTLGSGKRIFLCVGMKVGLVPSFFVTEDSKVYRAFVEVSSQGDVSLRWRDAAVVRSFSDLFCIKNPLCL